MLKPSILFKSKESSASSAFLKYSHGPNLNLTTVCVLILA